MKYLPLLFLVSIASLWLSVSRVSAVEEFCASCSRKLSISGDFAHRKESTTPALQGAGDNAAAFREDINGKNFTINISSLPEGQYTIVIGLVETQVSNKGDRIFTVTSDNVKLAENFDIITNAGGTGKVCYIRGVVDHLDDSLRGPLKVTFTSVKNNAKFNTFEVRDISGTPVLAFSAFELAEPFTGNATRIPDIKETSIWRDPSQPLRKRADDLISRMSLEEKVAQLRNEAPAIQRLGLPAYNYWNEALHGVANNGVATVFPEPVGMASTWNPQLLHQEGNVIGIEGREVQCLCLNAQWRLQMVDRSGLLDTEHQYLP